MFLTVGDIAERVSSRRLEPFPKVRGCVLLIAVFSVSRGLCPFNLEGGGNGAHDVDVAAEVDGGGHEDGT